MAVILTNKLDLPETIVKACKNDTHKVAGDFSVTQLIDSPRIRILKRTNDYEEDVSDMLFAMMGTALHHILEQANIDQVRQRAFLLVVDTIEQKARAMKVENATKAAELEKVAKYIFNLMGTFFPQLADRYMYEHTLRFDVHGRPVYGTFDLYDKLTCTLYDYKYCSVWAYMYPESQKKWMAQTNIYAYGLFLEGFEVKKIRIVAFLRDWHSSARVTNRDYPKTQVLEIAVEVVSMEIVGKAVENMVAKHIAAENAGLENLPECTGAERWAKADQWAVKTPSSKKAVRTYDDQQLAKDFHLENQSRLKGLYIEFRPGESVRCDKYCQVAKFCDQRQRELEYREKMKKNE